VTGHQNVFQFQFLFKKLNLSFCQLQMESGLLSPLSLYYATEQGIISAEQGILEQEQGILLAN
jgi:hypothetical protein